MSDVVEGCLAPLTRLGFEAVSPDSLDIQMRETLGGQATRFIHAVGVDAIVEDALAHSTRRGAVVLVETGTSRLSLPAYPISVGERTIIGSYCYTVDHFESTARWVASGQDDLDALVDTPISLDNGPDAFRSLTKSATDANMILLMPEHQE